MTEELLRDIWNYAGTDASARAQGYILKLIDAIRERDLLIEALQLESKDRLEKLMRAERTIEEMIGYGGRT